MKIKSVTIEGMHNVDKRTYEFSNLSYLVGPNGAGKSTAMQAIQLALLGYIPGTSKSSKEAIFRHANNHTMAVTLKLDDDGREVSIRRIWSGTKSSINSSVDIQPPLYDFSKVVADIELPIFNFNEFVGMTANKLKDWFIDFLPSVDISTDWDKVLRDDLEANAIAMQDDDLIKQSVKEIKAFGLKGSDEVRKANEYFKSMLSFKNKELERVQSTIQSLIYYDDVVMDKTPEEISSKISELEFQKSSQEAAYRMAQQNDRIKKQIAEYDDCTSTSYAEDPRFTESDDAIEANMKASDKANEQIATKQADISKLQDDKLKLSEKKAEIKMFIGTRTGIIDSEGICPFTNTKCESVQELIAQYKQEVEDAQKQISEIEEQMNAINAQIAAINDEIAALRSSISDCSKDVADKQTQKETIKHRYAQKDNLKKQLVIVPEAAVSGKDFDAEITALRDIQVKYAANKRYNEMIDKLTADKFSVESQIVMLKSWIKLTGVNGLQNDASATTPFIHLGAQMDKYIQAVFGSGTSSKFNLEAKANSFSFGVERDGKYIPFNLLSSGEKCMYTLALMMSLVEVSASPLKLIMIDDLLDHLDDINVNKLFESLTKVKDIQMIFAGVKAVSGDFIIEV